VCRELSQIRSAAARFAAGFDAELMSFEDARRVAKEAAAIEAVASTIKSLAAARVADGATASNGSRSAAEDLARETGSSIGAARDAIDTGRRLSSQRELSVAARQGEISFQKTSLIANAAESDPSAERRLVARARHASVAELKSICAETKAAAHPDLEARRQQIHSRRYLRSWSDVEGVWHLSAAANPEDGAQVMAALAPITDEIFESARTEGRRESPDAYAFDALLQMAREAATSEPAPHLSAPASRGAAKDKAGTGNVGAGHRRRGPPGAKILVRIDYDTFLRGVPTKGETCELVGFGPIAVSAVDELLETADPFVAAILTKGQELVGVAHLGRKPNSYQQSALEWIYPSCAAEGCHTQSRLEFDHRVDWSKTHYTMFDLLDRLCSHHHDLKTRDDWALVEGRGKRPFVPPDDPRHPGRRNKRCPASSKDPPDRAA